MIIDVSAYTGEWPFENHGENGPVAVADRCRNHGIDLALVSPTEGIFYKDPQVANDILLDAGMPNSLRLLPSLNPTLPHWRDCLSRCRQAPGVVGTKLHPNYHGYAPDDPELAPFWQHLGEWGMPVVVQLRMEDARTHHPLAMVAPVDVGQVLRVARRHPQLSVLLAGVAFSDLRQYRTEIDSLANVHVECSWLEYLDCLPAVLEMLDPGRLLFGTHQPFFYVESARAKLCECPLPEDAMEQIAWRNASILFRLETTPCGGD